MATHQKDSLRKILVNNKGVFRRTPGRINQYQHRLRVTDTTPDWLKGWPIPLKYQDAVKKEITMEAQWNEKPKPEWSQHIDKALYQEDKIIDHNKFSYVLKRKG